MVGSCLSLKEITKFRVGIEVKAKIKMTSTCCD